MPENSFLEVLPPEQPDTKKTDLPDIFRVSEKIIESELKKYFSQVSYSRKGIFL